LEGGTLLMTPLQAEDGEYYAMAQGALSVGGMIVADSKQRTRIQKNHTLAGNIPEGAIVKRELTQAALAEDGSFRWVLSSPDFSSAVAMAAAINKIYPGSAIAEDAAGVRVRLPSLSVDPMDMIAKTENVEFNTSTVARVVLNEKTGTLVAGADVRISEVAVAHGSIVINVDAKDSVSQPSPQSQGRSASVINEQVSMNAVERPPEVKVLPAVTNAGELAQALNSLGVAPRDIISIFQAIKRAGALQAELIVM
ncbi:MAG TPA: flagellar basal body P-ring protein FlgI, partial [Fibrobacteraceae bacterium]|nr:flagellar basal body P-ring protein FlgI [Fibrobacteraceae bacterium]